MKVGFWENKNVLLWNKKKAGSIGRGPFGAHLGGHVGGPGTHLGGIVGEAEGRHYGGRRPTKWGSGGEAPRNFGFSFFLCVGMVMHAEL